MNCIQNWTMINYVFLFSKNNIWYKFCYFMKSHKLISGLLAERDVCKKLLITYTISTHAVILGPNIMSAPKALVPLSSPMRQLHQHISCTDNGIWSLAEHFRSISSVAQYLTCAKDVLYNMQCWTPQNQTLSVTLTASRLNSLLWPTFFSNHSFYLC